MAKVKTVGIPGHGEPLTIERLEAALRVMEEAETDLALFWSENIGTFRQTVLLAIRDTSEALLCTRIPLHWRIELETQLEALVQYYELADRYIARHALSLGRRVLEFPSSERRLH